MALMVLVEFFGTPRLTVGRSSVTIAARTLGELLTALGQQFPRLAEAVLVGPVHELGLHPAYVVAINGEHFTADRGCALNPGDTVMLMAASAGG